MRTYLRFVVIRFPRNEASWFPVSCHPRSARSAGRDVAKAGVLPVTAWYLWRRARSDGDELWNRAWWCFSTLVDPMLSLPKPPCPQRTPPCSSQHHSRNPQGLVHVPKASASPPIMLSEMPAAALPSKLVKADHGIRVTKSGRRGFSLLPSLLRQNSTPQVTLVAEALCRSLPPSFPPPPPGFPLISVS